MARDLTRLMQALFLPAAAGCGDTHWRPPADVYRTARGWLVKLDLAGVRPGDLALAVRGRRLTVRGRRRDWAVEEGDRERINRSEVHVDFMIGSPEVDVTGITTSGDRVPVLRSGAWQI